MDETPLPISRVHVRDRLNCSAVNHQPTFSSHNGSGDPRRYTSRTRSWNSSTGGSSATGRTRQTRRYLIKQPSDEVTYLKHNKGKEKDIILVPQPSDSPRDPLNLPLWRRDFIFLIFCTNSAVIEAWAFMLSPGYNIISKDFGIVRHSILGSDCRATIPSTDNSERLRQF